MFRGIKLSFVQNYEFFLLHMLIMSYGWILDENTNQPIMFNLKTSSRSKDIIISKRRNCGH